MKLRILCVIFSVWLLCVIYSELPPAEIWANKLCYHLKQGVSCFFLWCSVMSVVEGETLILKPLVVLCLENFGGSSWSVCDVVMI
jgi:hypothetical protein